ncbi:concanavalin A-like lectin/glucanase domain-containing protein [Bisporella sp. PMI_857]|nr:concanavalin A-like lectin/glucanase domain-containing protein [Bisporella sp. PMI_857]
MPGEGIYYFEVKINECPPEQEKIIGIGFSTEGASVSSFVGYDSGSWGYHGSDGKVYLERYFGQLYAGITYGVRDTIGCGVDFDRGTAFFTRNGKHLGEAFGVPKRKLYPTVSFDTLKPLMGEGGSITAKFEEPFVCLNYASYTVANEGYNIGRSRTLLRR